jgi:hypothetical protein
MKIVYLAPHLSCGGCPQVILKRIQALMLYVDVIEQDAKELLPSNILATAHIELSCAIEKLEEARILIQAARASMFMHYVKSKQIQP